MGTRIAGRHGPGLCDCGNAELGCSPVEATSAAVDDGLLRTVFPDRVLRRRLIRAVGTGTLLAVLGDLLPLGDLRALAQERAAPERPTIKAGFLPLTCAAPLVIGHERGIYAKHGIALDLVKVPGIALIRDRMLAGELDISQQVMPVALSTSAGAGGAVIPTKVLTVLNQNGNALVLANKHKDNRNPRKWRGFSFAVPFEQSHQNLQLRAYANRRLFQSRGNLKGEPRASVNRVDDRLVRSARVPLLAGAPLVEHR
jgi:nitrate/nitrite transport system substrate-binding protein